MGELSFFIILLLVALLIVKLDKERSLKSGKGLPGHASPNIQPVVESLGMKSGHTNLDNQAQASLQLAYAGSRSLQFYYGKDFGVGVYETQSRLDSAEYTSFATVYIHKLRFMSPHFYFDNKSNNSRFKRNFPIIMDKEQLVVYEGYMQERFDLYAPDGYKIDSLVVGAPDVLDAILRLNMGGDVEIIGDQLYIIFPKVIDLVKLLPQLIENGQELAREFADNLSRYKDDRFISRSQPIGYEGRWLVRK